MNRRVCLSIRRNSSSYNSRSAGAAAQNLKEQIGTDQKRMIEISGNQMKYTNPGASAGGTAVLTFTRAM
jgi:hypothetical protein